MSLSSLAMILESDTRFRVFGLIAGLLLGGLPAVFGAEPSPETLGKVLADAKAPLGDRIGAIVGLQAQAKKLADDRQLAAEVAPAVFGLLATPPEGDPKAVAWLVSRGLEVLPALPVTPAVVETVAAIVADPSRDLDVRVRAAGALGQLAATSPPAKVPETLSAIRGLAISTLKAELDAAARRRLEREFAMGSLSSLTMLQPGETGGFMQEGMDRRAGREGFGSEDEDSVSKTECRRAAWRLTQLADAIAPAKGSKSQAGLAAALEPGAKETADELAAGIRTIALTSLLAKTLPPDPNSPQTAGGEAGFARGGMDAMGMVPAGFDAVIEAALVEAEALPDPVSAGR